MKLFSAILLLNLTLFAMLAPSAGGVVALLEKSCEGQEKSCCHAPQEESRDIAGCNSHSEEGEGHCSPFCHCACCGQAVAILLLRCSVRGEAVAAQHQPAYVASYDFEYTHHIWQPPRQG